MSDSQVYSAPYSNNTIESRMAGSWSRHTASQGISAGTADSTPISFLEFIKGALDVINPLQHIPVVGAIYRHLTGDEISPAARIAGGTLFGGPIGGTLALADVAYESTTGNSVGETMIAALTGHEKEKVAPLTPDASEVMIAQNLETTVLPASGGPVPNDIIWDDASPPSAAVASISSHPLPPPTLPTHEVTDGTGPVWRASLHAPSGPFQQVEANTALEAPKAPVAVAKLPASSQEAPTVPSRMEMPSELIAAKMMDALEQYQKLKQAPNGMLLSAGY